MKLLVENISFNVECDLKKIKDYTPIVFLHGFTGCSNDWYFVQGKLPSGFTEIFIDLIGHGNSSSPEEKRYYYSGKQIELLHKIFRSLNLNKIILVGYSMGGRLALQYSLKYPENLRALILESTSFGIYSQADRIERVKKDEQLAEEILKTSISKFIKKWTSLPLFNTLKNVNKEKYEELLRLKIESNNQIGLANSLKGFSAGRMEYYGNKNLMIDNVMLITGELDEKFNNIANEYFRNKKNVIHRIISQTGHNTHFEKPKEFLKLLNQFLISIKE